MLIKMYWGQCGEMAQVFGTLTSGDPHRTQGVVLPLEAIAWPWSSAC